MKDVLFKHGLQENYDALETKEENCLYFLTDSQRIYKGDTMLSASNVRLAATAPSIEEALDDVIYIVFADGVYTLYIKNGDEVSPVITSRKDVNISDVSYDASVEGDNAIWTFTLSDGNKKEIQTPKENFLSAASIDPETNHLNLTLSNGDKVEVDLSEMMATSDSVKLTEDIGFIGVSPYGGIPSKGFTRGQSLTQILKSLIQKEQDAKVVQPSLSISLSGASTSVESGTKVTPTIKASFNKGSYSPGLPADTGVTLSVYKLTRTDNSVIEDVVNATAIESFTEAEAVTVGDGATLTYRATCDHTAGATPTTNMGNPSSQKAIAAATGKASNTVTITGYRKYFIGATTDKPEMNSAFVRGLKTSNKYAAGDVTLTVPAGSQRVVIACPADKAGMKKVINTTALNADVTGTFAKQTVQVEGANGFEPVAYNVWVYEPAVPYGQQAVLKVTLG